MFAFAFYKLGVYVTWDIIQFLHVEIEICFCVGHCQLQLVYATCGVLKWNTCW